MPECFLSVLGLTASAAKDQRVEGVGKSSLCFRFVHPSQTEYAAYGEDHESVMSLADFRDAEVNKDHFVYFGKARRDYLSSGSDNLLPLTVHVVEQTEFVDDASYRPLGKLKPYAERTAEANLSSHGKVAYYSRSTLGIHGIREQRREALPSEFGSRGPEGYLFVLDPTSCAERRKEQIELLDECLHRLPKKKPVAVVVSKCDLLPAKIRKNMESADFDLVQYFLEESRKEKQFVGTMRKDKKPTKLLFQPMAGRMEIRWKKLVVPHFYASARDGVGVDVPFLHLAHKVLQLSGSAAQPLPYSNLLEGFAALKDTLKSVVDGLLRKYVKEETTTWAQTRPELLGNRDFESYETIFGEEKGRELFDARLIEIASLKTSTLSVEADGLGEVDDNEIEESSEEGVYEDPERPDEHIYIDIGEGCVKENRTRVRCTEHNASILASSTYSTIRQDQRLNWQLPRKQGTYCDNTMSSSDTSEVRNSRDLFLPDNHRAFTQRAMQLPLLAQLELATDLLQNVQQRVIGKCPQGTDSAHYVDILPPKEAVLERPATMTANSQDTGGAVKQVQGDLSASQAPRLEEVTPRLHLAAAASSTQASSSKRQQDILAQLEITTSLLEDLRTILREDREDARYLRLLNKCDTEKADGVFSTHDECNASSRARGHLAGRKDVDEAGYLLMRSLGDENVDEAGYSVMHRDKNVDES